MCIRDRYQADEFRKRLAIKMKRKIDLKLAIESEKLGIQYMNCLLYTSRCV